MTPYVVSTFGKPTEGMYHQIMDIPKLVKIAILGAASRGLVRDPDALLDDITPTLRQIEMTASLATLHLKGAVARAMNREATGVAAAERAQRTIARALREVQADLIRDGFDPHGCFVYCLWGDDAERPIYVGKSTNVLDRLGTHVRKHGGRIRRITLLRCKSGRQMDETEGRLIREYRPPLNIAGKPST